MVTQDAASRKFYGLSEDAWREMDFFDLMQLCHEQGEFKKLIISKQNQDREFARAAEEPGAPLSFDQFRRRYGAGHFRLQAVRGGEYSGTLRQQDLVVSPELNQELHSAPAVTRTVQQSQPTYHQPAPAYPAESVASPANNPELESLRVELERANRRADEAERARERDRQEAKEREERETLRAWQRSIDEKLNSLNRPQGFDAQMFETLTGQVRQAYELVNASAQTQSKVEPPSLDSKAEELLKIVALSKELGQEGVPWGEIIAAVSGGLGNVAQMAVSFLASKNMTHEQAQMVAEAQASDAQAQAPQQLDHEGDEEPDEVEMVRVDRVFIMELVEAFGDPESEALLAAFAAVKAKAGEEGAAAVIEAWEPYLALELEDEQSERQIRAFIMQAVPPLKRIAAARYIGKPDVRMWVIRVLRTFAAMVQGVALGNTQYTKLYEQAVSA